MEQKFVCFNVIWRSWGCSSKTLTDTCPSNDKWTNLIDYLKQNEQDIRDITGITKKLQGPEGHISYQTFESVVLLHEELGHIENIFSRIGRPDLLEKFNLLSITTLSLESQHAVVHFKTDTPTPLEYMRNLSTSVHEAVKRVTPSPVQYSIWRTTSQNSCSLLGYSNEGPTNLLMQ